MNVTFTHVHRYVHVNHMKTDWLSSPIAKNMPPGTVGYREPLKSRMRLQSSGLPNHLDGTEFVDVLDVFVSPVAAVSITFSCHLETLPLSFSLIAIRVCVFAARISIFAARLCIRCAFL